MNLPFVIVYFNTPKLTTCLCSSIRKYYPNNEIIIFDNSTILKFPKETIKLFNITYLDNTTNNFLNFEKKNKNFKKDEKIVKQNNLGSAKHCITIDFLINFLDKNFILLDSDVLLKKQLDFINEKYITCGLLSIDEQKLKSNRQLRIYPFLQFFNTKKIKENKLSYFNPNEMVGLDCKPIIFDTGASFYKSLTKLNPTEYKTDINIFNYIVHLNAGSWSKTMYESWLLKYKSLWN